jgi:threonine/homoserine/homoserine lactone efflux protein
VCPEAAEIEYLRPRPGSYRTGVPSATAFLAYAALVIVLVAVPGPSVLFTIGRALTVGRRSALLTVAGNAAGLCGQVVAVAFGLGALVQRSATAFTILKWAGSLYLIYLGIQAVRHRRSVAEALRAQVRPVPPGRAIRDGFVVGLLNPKSIAFFVIVLPQFTDRVAGSIPLQMLALGTLFPLVAVVLDSGWALAAGSAGAWLARSPRRLERIGGAGGLIIIGLGVRLALSGRKD